MHQDQLNDLHDQDLAFAMKARQALRASESLDYVEAARLAATRAQARELVAKPHRLPVWGWIAAPATAAAVVAVIALRLGGQAAQPVAVPPAGVLVSVAADVNEVAPETLIWVSDEAGPDFYRDLAFYEWLQGRLPSEPNA